MKIENNRNLKQVIASASEDDPNSVLLGINTKRETPSRIKEAIQKERDEKKTPSKSGEKSEAKPQTDISKQTKPQEVTEDQKLNAKTPETKSDTKTAEQVTQKPLMIEGTPGQERPHKEQIPDGYKLNMMLVEKRSARINVALTKTLYDRIKKCAKERHLSVNELINRTLEENL